MTCSKLGFDDYGNLRCSKSQDTEENVGPFPSGYDLSGYTGTFVIRATEGASTALLTVTGTATANGSVLTFTTSYLKVLLKKADLQTLPAGATADAAWEGVYEWVLTDTLGLSSRLVSGAIVVEKGVVR